MYRMKLDKELLININHKQPLDLHKLSGFLLSIQGLCNDYLQDKNYIIPANGIQFKLSGTNKGSIELTFAAFVAGGMIALQDPNTLPAMTAIIDYIRASIDFYANNNKASSKDFKPSIENASHIIQLTDLAHDNATVTNMTFNVGNNNIILLNSQLATKALTGANTYLAEAKKTFERDLTRVLMKIDTLKDNDINKGWRAIIYDSQVPDDKSFPAVFSNFVDRDYIKDFKENPLHYKFWVDVQVRYNEGNITAYNITQIHKDEEPIEIEPKASKKTKQIKRVHQARRKKAPKGKQK